MKNEQLGVVYVVDDDPSFRDDAPEAGSACVLTDLRMPGLDGLQLQQLIDNRETTRGARMAASGR